MKTLHQIRFENFETLIKEAGSVAELARQCGYNKPAYFYQVRSQTIKPNGKPLQLGKRICANLERGMGKPFGWMDVDHSSTAGLPALTGKLKESNGTITLALTGASGALYGMRLLECLLSAGKTVYVLISAAARTVAKQELQLDLPESAKATQNVLCTRFAVKPAQLRVFANDDWFAPIASGNGSADAMVICPASMGTVAALAHGTSDSLMERAADVMIKERRPVVIVPREAPLSTIHLENLLKLSQVDCTILPPAAGFYHNPQTVDDMVDFVVAKILDQLHITHSLVPKWGQ
ncbi:flavin prenyltransferase UbiX [Wielerella bovis]|uniref:flavin prenyltransferase UbiX n=1 Tax=Wielerella bovis TaxID=2917790 RepID=UPI003211CB70